MSEKCKWLHEQLESLPVVAYPFTLDQLPDNGIYFLYEKGEKWGHGEEKPRLVQIGTHNNGNFKNRIEEHFLLNKSKMNFDINKNAPKDRSILRKNIGRALLNKNNDKYIEVWNRDFTIRENRKEYGNKRDIIKEKDLEFQITEILRENFSFRFIILDELISRFNLKKSLIGTINDCELCRKSNNWLGNHSPNKQIKNSGLWLIQYLKSNAINENDKKVISDAVNSTKEWIKENSTLDLI